MRYLKNFIWPTQENDYQPAILKPASLAIILTIFFVWNAATRIILGSIPAEANDLTIPSIISGVNRERSLRNLLTLNTNDKLGLAAQWKADDMINRNYFAHVDPDGNYIWPKITADGYTPYLQLGENLAVDFYDTDSLIAAWMNSPTHRANVLNEGFKDQGMGLSFGNVANGQYYSSIANTFGALLVSKITAPAPAPAPTPAPKPSTTTAPPPATITPPKPAPPATAAPTQTPVTAKPPASSGGPVAIRGSSTPAQTATGTAGSAATATPATATPAGVTGSQPQSPKSTNLYKVNHYMVLGFGIAFLFLMASDLRIILERRVILLDKKLNNIFVLALALVIIALVYWL